MTEIEQRPAGALAVRPGQTDWTSDQIAALQHLGIDSSVGGGDLKVFLTYAQRTGLDPFARQIYLIGRRQFDNEKKAWTKKWTIQCGIDGFRIVAQRSGKYRGQTPAQWCGEDGQWRDTWLSADPPSAARAGVLHADFDAPLYAVALWSEYAQTTSKGELTAMWKRYGALMLHKCAEALALRRAFPHDLSGLYTVDEMGSQEQPTRVITAPPPPADQSPLLTLDELTASAAMATTLTELQETWRQAGRAALLDAETVNAATGEVVLLRNYLIGLVSAVDAADNEAGGGEEPVVSAGEPAAPQPEPDEELTGE